MHLLKTLTNSAPEWVDLLQEELKLPYFEELSALLEKERSVQKIFPPENLVFECFRLTRPKNLKVVLLGQDPYHGDNQAHGLCFSVPQGTAFPPSLRNIFKELKSDLKIEIPLSGDLSKWAHEGVLLLNTTLTVRRGEAGSHFGKGWERFTDEVIRTINNRFDGVVFLLWGGPSRKKSKLIDPSKHLILEANHPSPLSANRGGFFGCRHFSKTNVYLKEKGNTPIDWSL